MQTGSGTFIAFATEPDSVAADGTGRNSPFTTALLKHIDQPGQSISDMMIAVRNDVLAATGGHQRPWESSSLTDRFAFTPDPVRDASSLRKLPEQAGHAPAKTTWSSKPTSKRSRSAVAAPTRRSGAAIPIPSTPNSPRNAPRSACAAPESQEVATAAAVPRAIAAPKKQGTCEDGPFDVAYCASSVLTASKTNHYEPSMMFDGNRATAWVEGDEEDGIGQNHHHAFRAASARWSASRSSTATTRTRRSGRPIRASRSLEASTGDGQVQVITLKDVRGSSRFDFDAPIETSWLQLTIKSVYPGTKYQDTAISELYPIFAD